MTILSHAWFVINLSQTQGVFIDSSLIIDIRTNYILTKQIYFNQPNILLNIFEMTDYILITKYIPIESTKIKNNFISIILTTMEMVSLSSWIDNITISELLHDAPSGFLSGCGGTTEFLNFVFRTKPTSNKYREICRQHYYFDTQTETVTFTFDEVDKFIDSIKERLDLYDYVTISFSNEDYNQQNIKDHMINGYPIPYLFDHSFILTKDNQRFESYLGYYGPIQIYWEDYEKDLRELFINPHQKWQQLFNVRCKTEFHPDKIRLIVNN